MQLYRQVLGGGLLYKCRPDAWMLSETKYQGHCVTHHVTLRAIEAHTVLE